MNPVHFRDEVIIPTLRKINMHSDSAVNLLLGTAIQESNLHYLRQLDDGPALGFYQMEPSTHKDIWLNYLKYRQPIVDSLASITKSTAPMQLVTNLAYATAMARIHYRRVPQALPDADDIHGLAQYWKDYYNTELGKGTAEEFIQNYNDSRDIYAF